MHAERTETGQGAAGFPRQHARTRRFTLGLPRTATVAPDGRVLFLRSAAGDDPVTELWELVPAGEDGPARERRLVDPRVLGTEAPDGLAPAERARRERQRELAGGITAYATDRVVALVAFSLGGRLYTLDVARGAVAEQPTEGPSFDPRPSPDGARVVHVVGDAVHLVELVGGPGSPGASRPLAVEEDAAWGRAEFVAAEEMGRGRGTWWAPDSDRVAVTRVDESEVAVWHLSDPATPWLAPTPQRYPAAGTANADVRLAVLDTDGGRRVDVAWDRGTFPYLARVSWDPGPLTLQVQTRDQRRSQVLVADPDTGACEVVRELHDPSWVELVPGSPAWSGERLVTVEDLAAHGPDGSRALLVAGEVVTPPGLQVRGVIHADAASVLVTASSQDPTQVHVWRWTEQGLACLTDAEPGVHAATASAAAVVTSRAAFRGRPPQVTVTWEGRPAHHALEVRAETPTVTPRPLLLELGPHRLRGALLLPEGADARSPLPVLLDPYGGPHAQRVVASDTAFATSQWFADQGYAVLVVDGRGTPGRGPSWERAVAGDLATPVLEDQVTALHAAAEAEPRLDLDRVAIRGWSFGGYLAALAVLRRPDVFRAAIAGAPVTDWRLYDTHYTERYLGHPDEQPDAYRRSSLVDGDAGLTDAAAWDPRCPPALLLIHGLADDNVVAAHTLRLSAALLADGRPHRFLPLSGVTHMTPQEVVAEALLELQAAFLAETIGTGRR